MEACMHWGRKKRKGGVEDPVEENSEKFRKVPHDIGPKGLKRD